MPDSFRVFVSSTHRDLATERILVQELLETLAKETEGFGYFAPRSQPSVASTLEAMRGCDMAVFVLGHSYGALAPGFPVSHVECEYREAVKLGIPMLNFLRQEGYGLMPGQFEKEPARAARLQELRARLQSGSSRTFTDAPSLATVMRKALEAEIYLRGLPRRLPTRSIPFVSGSGAPPPPPPVEGFMEPVKGRATQTLPRLQKALSTPYVEKKPFPSWLWWALGGAVTVAVFVFGFLIKS